MTKLSRRTARTRDERPPRACRSSRSRQVRILGGLAVTFGVFIAAPVHSRAQAPPASWRLREIEHATVRDDAVGGIVVGAHGTSDGRMIVVLRRGASVREYSARGVFIAERARQGRGPGELVDASWSTVQRDTLWVYDPALRRLSWYSVHEWSRFGSFALHDLSHGQSRVLGRLISGDVIIASEDSDDAPPRDGLRTRLERVQIIRPGGVATPVDTVQSIVTTLVYRLGHRPGAPYVSALHPLTANVYMCAAGARIARMSADTTTVRLFGPDGKVAGVATLAIERRALDSRALSAAVRTARSRAEPTDTLIIGLRYDSRFWPRMAPMSSGLRCANSGDVWVHLFSEDFLADSRFLVVQRDGMPQARVTLPAQLVLRDVLDDRVLATTTSVRDGLVLRAFSIEKGEPKR